MRIAQLVSNLHPVFPEANNAIYSHTAWLANGLVDLRHDVTLFASGDSNIKGKLTATSAQALAKSKISDDLIKYYLSLQISKCYAQANNFDIIHSHFTLLTSFYSCLVKTPTVQSIHSPIREELKPLLLNFKNNKYISFSLAQRKTMPELNWTANIYHGVDTDRFSFNPAPQDYFLFLGRITEEKGVHLAIEAAKAANMPLIIAGRSYPAEGYWHNQIEKHIDGKMIRYVGEADLEKKIEWLRNAKGLLFPTQYAETFGLVMIEAMACGTPVIGWDNGSVNEIIQDKKTGYVVKSLDEMVEAIKNIDKISREETRKRAENFFSVKKMVRGYARIYERIIEEDRFKKKKEADRFLPKDIANLLLKFFQKESGK